MLRLGNVITIVMRLLYAMTSFMNCFVLEDQNDKSKLFPVFYHIAVFTTLLNLYIQKYRKGQILFYMKYRNFCLYILLVLIEIATTHAQQIFLH